MFQISSEGAEVGGLGYIYLLSIGLICVISCIEYDDLPIDFTLKDCPDADLLINDSLSLHLERSELIYR